MTAGKYGQGEIPAAPGTIPSAETAGARARESLLAGALLVLLLVLAFFPVVFGGRTLQTAAWCPGTMPSGPFGGGNAPAGLPVIDPGSSSWQNEPWAAKVRKGFKTGEWPLWNAGSGVGAPLLANMQSAPFSPLRILPHLSSSPAAWDAYYLLRLLLAGLFTYMFLRSWNRSPAASFAGAVVFMFTGYNILYINMGHLDVDILVPALLFVFESLFRKRRAGTIVAAALLVCTSILGGMPESACFALLFAMAYYAFRTASAAAALRARPSFYAMHALRFALPVVLGLLLSGPQLFPFIEYLGRSWTSHGASTGTTSNPLSGVLSLIVPFFFGGVHQNWNGLSSHALLPYLGGIPVLLGLMAVLSKKSAEESRIVSFFSVFALVLLGKAYGLAVINWIGRLPLLKTLIFAKYTMPVIAICVATLAAYGLDALLGLRLTARRILAALGILLAFLFLSLGVKPLEFFPQLKDQRVWRYAAAQTGMTLAAVAVFFLLGLAGLRLRRRAFLGLGLAAILAAELMIYIPRERAVRHDLAAPPPYVGFLKADRSSFRVLPLSGALHPNTGAYFDLESIAVLDAMYPYRYMAYLRSCLSPDIHDRFTGGELSGDVEPLLYHLRFLNVKYIITPVYLYDSIADILRRSTITPADRWGIGLTRYTINGLTQAVLSQHPPSNISHPCSPSGDGRLSFSIALAPECWSPTLGDGVRFRVSVRDGADLRKVFERSIDPKRNPAHRRWLDAEVDLGAYRGKNIEVIFETDPLNDNEFDWAGWGGIRFGSRNESGSLELVYDQEVKIYRIDAPLPRAHIAPRQVKVGNGRQALDMLKMGRLDLRHYVILEPDGREARGARAANRSPSLAGHAEILSYRSREVVIDAEAPQGGILVLSDMHDPGWKAFVDGRERPVMKADYLFRGVDLEPGRHRVRFSYAPRSFAWGWRASLLALAGLAAVGLVSRRRPATPKSGRNP